jgi:hypothetical protein
MDLSEDKVKESLEKYDRRETFWAQQSLNQLGYSINIFFTVGIALLAYLNIQRKNYPEFQYITRGDIDWSLVLFYLVLAFVLLSVLIGLSATIIRLKDLRITRHINSTRKTAMKLWKKPLPENYIDFKKESLWKAFFNGLFKKIKFVHIKDNITHNSIIADFENLRKQAKLLGRITWKAHTVQMIFMFIALVLYGITLI